MRRFMNNGYRVAESKPMNHDISRSGTFHQMFGAEVPSSVLDWVNKNASRGNEFASSLLGQLKSKGTLSGPQVLAVQRTIERETERAKSEAARLATSPSVTLDSVMVAFRTAQKKGVKRPRLRLEGFTLSLAPDNGVNAGAIYVKDDAGTYLGKVVTGRFLAVNNVSPEVQASVVEACKNPLDSAKAYGRRTGQCSVCSRELTNHASIDLGIGPICAEKFGW